MNFDYFNFCKFSKSLLTQTILLTCLVSCLVSCKSNKHRSSSRPQKTVSKKETPKINVDAKAEKAIKTARSYIGTKYQYGGCSRAGMDCSGLVYTSYKEVGITLPRTSSAQSSIGKTISLQEIQEGDLVFFTDRKGGKKVTHVGMVTEVRGKDDVKFIHASTKLGVVENDLYSEYYKSIFVKAVRVI